MDQVHKTLAMNFNDETLLMVNGHLNNNDRNYELRKHNE